MPADFTLPDDYLKSTPKKELTLPDGFNGVVLHCCCAPCSTAVLECLLFFGIKPVLFFYNPNIQPKAEYEKRREEWLHLANLLKLEAVNGDYDVREWLLKTKGLEHEPERGLRCDVCFTHRLTVTASFAKSRGITYFTTTLATSRWKNKAQVDRAGFKAQDCVKGTKYWDLDWRKNGLVSRRYELVKKIGFYNQLYCGCLFSKDEAQGYLKKDRDTTIRFKLGCVPDNLVTSSSKTDHLPQT
ncbi:MAG: epoxyqueuosine reductase QueH [Succinivibrio sp.]|nr:epoxyqueuosine reductase QueH [Succinivibrio sp.]